MGNWVTVWVALISVAGTLGATTLAYRYQIKREDRKNKQDEEKRIKDSIFQSDAICWRKIKSSLDNVYWETQIIRPGARPLSDGTGLVVDPFVATAHKELLEAANNALKTLHSVTFNDEESQAALEAIMKTFQDIILNANASKYYRDQIQQHGLILRSSTPI